MYLKTNIYNCPKYFSLFILFNKNSCLYKECYPAKRFNILSCIFPQLKENENINFKQKNNINVQLAIYGFLIIRFFAGYGYVIRLNNQERIMGYGNREL